MLPDIETHSTVIPDMTWRSFWCFFPDFWYVPVFLCCCVLLCASNVLAVMVVKNSRKKIRRYFLCRVIWSWLWYYSFWLTNSATLSLSYFNHIVGRCGFFSSYRADPSNPSIHHWLSHPPLVAPPRPPTGSEWRFNFFSVLTYFLFYLLLCNHHVLTVMNFPNDPIIAAQSRTFNIYERGAIYVLSLLSFLFPSNRLVAVVSFARWLRWSSTQTV